MSLEKFLNTPITLAGQESSIELFLEVRMGTIIRDLKDIQREYTAEEQEKPLLEAFLKAWGVFNTFLEKSNTRTATKEDFLAAQESLDTARYTLEEWLKQTKLRVNEELADETDPLPAIITNGFFITGQQLPDDLAILKRQLQISFVQDYGQERGGKS